MFVYVLINPGMEPWLKAEAAFRHPHLKVSYSQQGLMTFKTEDDRGEPHFWFSRLSGRFLVKAKAADLESAVETHRQNRVVHRVDLAAGVASGTTAALGAQVLDVLDVGKGEFWLGFRTIRYSTWPLPGGWPLLNLPPQSPSRAWLKAEQQLAWSGWSPQSGTVAVELGSAPGGATWALLNRGVLVTGVDLAPMDALCLEHPGYTHVALSVRDLRKKHLPAHIHALFCDLGLSPVEAIPQIREICHLHPEITRLFYTLKLGKLIPMSDLQRHLDALHALGFTLRCTHLPANKSELTVIGFRDILAGT